jgi:glycosyltransferase involved in cell wall biosynthesis
VLLRAAHIRGETRARNRYIYGVDPAPVQGSPRLSTSSPLTIGIDARAASEVPAGRGRVVRELLRALAEREHDDYRYFLYARSAWTEQPLDERFSWRLIGAPEPWWHVLAARAANRECDVFLSSNSYLTIAFTRIPTVPIVYDMVTFEPTMRPNRRSTVIERLTLGMAVRRSTSLLAISQATADALGKRFPRAVGRTVVAPLGVTPALAGRLDAKEAETLPAAGFVLAVGTLEPRKNLPRLVEAYRRLERGARRAVSPLRGLQLPLARRGLRSAGARGDGGGRGGAHVESLLAAGGGWRRGRLRRPARYGLDRLRPARHAGG